MRMNKQCALGVIRFPQVRDHPARQTQDFARLLETGILTKARKQFVQAWMERVTLLDFRRPSLIRLRHHPLLHRRSESVRIRSSDRSRIYLVGHVFQQASAQDRIELDAIEANWGDVERSTAHLLTRVVNRL